MAWILKLLILLSKSIVMIPRLLGRKNIAHGLDFKVVDFAVEEYCYDSSIVREKKISLMVSLSNHMSDSSARR